MEPATIARLLTKEAGAAIVERIQRDFQLAPVVAQTLIAQLHRYEEESSPQRREKGQLADIARELNHAQHAVDRYIKDYEVTRTLPQKSPLHEIPALAQLAPSLVREHVQLIHEYEPKLAVYSSEPATAAQTAK